MKELHEKITENGIDYQLVGDYYIPVLRLPDERRPIGKWGWVQRMGNIQNRAEEIIRAEMIYT